MSPCCLYTIGMKQNGSSGAHMALMAVQPVGGNTDVLVGLPRFFGYTRLIWQIDRHLDHATNRPSRSRSPIPRAHDPYSSRDHVRPDHYHQHHRKGRTIRDYRNDYGSRTYEDRGREGTRNHRSFILPPAVYVIDIADFYNNCLSNHTVQPASAYDEDLRSIFLDGERANILQIRPTQAWCAANECW
jgi:hypothetical protein